MLEIVIASHMVGLLAWSAKSHYLMNMGVPLADSKYFDMLSKDFPVR